MRREDRQARLGRFEQDDPAIRRQLRPQPLDQRDKARLDKQQPVLCVIDDIDDLLVEQARVDRVAHRADAGDAVIQLEMAEIVPRQGADPVAGSDPEPQQRLRQTPRAALGLVRRCSGGSSDRRGARPSRHRRDSAPRAGSGPRSATAAPPSTRACLSSLAPNRTRSDYSLTRPENRPGRPGRSRQSRHCGPHRGAAHPRRRDRATRRHRGDGVSRCRTSIMCRWTFRTRSTPS